MNAAEKANALKPVSLSEIRFVLEKYWQPQNSSENCPLTKKDTIKNRNADFLTATVVPHSEFEISVLEASIFYLKKIALDPKFSIENLNIYLSVCALLFSPPPPLFEFFSFGLFLINRADL